MDDEAIERLREGLRGIYPEVDWKDKHIATLRGLYGKEGKEMMEWQTKHDTKDLGKFLSRIDVDVEQD